MRNGEPPGHTFIFPEVHSRALYCTMIYDTEGGYCHIYR